MKIRVSVLSIILIISMLLSSFTLVGCNKISDDNNENQGEEKREPMGKKEVIQYAKARTVTVKTNLGSGSGFFIDDKGTLITNYHVIDGVDTIDVTTNDNATHTVTEIVDFSELYDIAVLKIDKTNTPYLNIFKGEVVDGEEVYAIGSPLGMEGISTDGMISKPSEKWGVLDCIVSTAHINHGNSGGPLVNEYGEVVGINTLGHREDEVLAFSVNIKTLDKLTMDKHWSVNRYRDWYSKELMRSFKIYLTEYTDRYVFMGSTIHTYQEVTGAEPKYSYNTSSNIGDGYLEECVYHAYSYNFADLEKYTEYIFGLGFELYESKTELDEVIYLYVNTFTGITIQVGVLRNEIVIFRVSS